MTEETRPELLIVDDDVAIAELLKHVLGADFVVHTADSRAEAKRLLGLLEAPPQLALVDLGLPPAPNQPDEGFRLISDLVASYPGIKIVVLSGQNDEANARHARTLGALDFVAKPCDPSKLKDLLTGILSVRNTELSAEAVGGLLGRSLPIEKLRKQISQFAAAPFPVLIEGESGSGKEIVAKLLHSTSRRADRPLIAVNCAAMSASLVEAALFGHAKGAFTGATTSRNGYFEEANDSTLFLDEIGELPLELQAKLLRVLESGDFQRVGETQSRHSNARIIAATNRDMRAEIRAGRFRADLYHRVSVFTLSVPPLRDLGDDKCLLLDHYRDFYAGQTGTEPFHLDRRAMDLWLDYSFPGNVRELRNIVIRLTAKHGGRTVSVEELGPELDMESMTIELPGVPRTADFSALLEFARRHLEVDKNFTLDFAIQEWERAYVDVALAITEGNLTRAAKLLGISRSTLYSRMQKYPNPVAPVKAPVSAVPAHRG